MKTYLRIALLVSLTLHLPLGLSQHVDLIQVNGSFRDPVHEFLSHPNGSNLVASLSGILATSDGGVTLQRVFDDRASGKTRGCLAIASRGDTILASMYSEDVSTDHLVLSVDGGLVWTPITETTVNRRRFETLLVLPGGVMLAGGVAPFRSTDGGMTWSVTGTTAQRPVKSLARAHDGSILLVTTTTVFRSTDQGATWGQTSGAEWFMTGFDVSVLPSGTVLLGSSTGIHRSTDHGATWDSVYTASAVKASTSLTSGRLYAAGPTGPLMVSTDDGATWSEGPSIPDLQVNTIRYTLDSLLLIGHSAGALYSADSGTTWKQVGENVISGKVTAVGTRGSENAIVIRDQQQLFETADFNLWNESGDGLPNDSLLSVATCGPLSFVGTATQGLYASSHMGGSWTKVAGGFPASARVAVVRRTSGSTIIAGTSLGVFYSTDSGKVWSSWTLMSASNVISISEEIADTVYGGTSEGFVIHSTNGGSSWQDVGTDALGYPVLSVLPLGNGVVIAGTHSGGLYRSVDGGEHWTATVNALSAASIRALVDAGGGFVYAGSDSGLYGSADLGDTWARIGSLPTQTAVNALAVNSSAYLVVATDDHGLFKSTEPAQPTVTHEYRWMNAGSVHSWYSSVGAEIEHALLPSQQYGFQWPAVRPYQDMKSSNALWVGTTHFEEDDGTTVPYKVVHAGPRVYGDGEFFPLSIRAVSRHAPTIVTVDGVTSTDQKTEVDDIDTTLFADRMIESLTNTSIGLTIERRVFQFSQEFHGNYIVTEYVFRNTGNTDLDPFTERSGKTLTGVYFWMMNRYAINRSIRYIVNNSSGWGINTMHDDRGFPPDIANPLVDATENDVKARFAWHGYHDAASKPASGPGDFDNIGAPVFDPSLSQSYLPANDTTWRLGGTQFVGTVHLYADVSASNKTAAADQPATTTYVGSDDSITRNNSQFDIQKMGQEYAAMSAGHTARHAWIVMPDGKFSEQKVMGNFGNGAPGGWSQGTGYGPYTLGPGDSIRIVVAEAANGLTEEESIRIGQYYKSGIISTKQKNDSVLTVGRMRIVDTFRKASAAYNAQFAIPRPPLPPSSVTVAKQPWSVLITWNPPMQSGPSIRGYEVYRSDNGIGSVYSKVFQGDEDSCSFEDNLVTTGKSYHYYVVSVGDSAENNGAALTPLGPLRSGRTFTQTLHPVVFDGSVSVEDADESGDVPNEYRLFDNYPNPFNPSTTIAFALPAHSHVLIEIYNVLGQKITTLVDEELTAGTHRATWSASEPSGIYFCRMTARETDDTSDRGRFDAVKKLLLLR